MRIAFWLETPNQAACEIAALAGYDIVLFDMEHGAFDPRDLDRLVPFCAGLGLSPVVRVAAPERVPIQQALDVGAEAVILPQICDADHARTASAFAKYPPHGSRGIGFGRIQGYGATDADFPEGENRRTLCYAMIETPTALAEAAAIAAIATVDGLFVGPSDLSLSRGRGLNRWTDEDFADVEAAATAARTAGKRFATTGAENPVVRRLGVRAGADFMSAGDDLSALSLGFAALIAKTREED